MDADYDNIFNIDPSRLRHRLKEPIDVNRLLSDDGLAFEVDSQPSFLGDDALEGPFEERDFQDGLHECGLISDDSGDEDGDNRAASGLSLFERKRARMADITAGQRLVFKRVVQPGDGARVPDKALVYYHYRMYLEDVDEPFDSSRFRRREERQRVGVGSMLEGMELALLSMRKRERAVFLLDHRVMYGALGCPPRIPGEAEIYAELEVLDYVEKQEMEEFYELSAEERDDLPYEKVIGVVKECRNDGNAAFRNQRYAAAARKYMRSRDILASVSVKDEAEDLERNRELMKILLNLATCYKKLGRGPLCITICNEVLDLDGDAVKAHYLKGVALSSLGEFERAAACLGRANRGRPHDREILDAIAENNRKAEEYQELDRMRCRRMFGFTEKAKPKEENVTPDLTTDFARRLATNLQEFLEDKDSTTYPDFDTKCLSRAEVAVLEVVARDKGLRVVKKDHMWSLRKQ